MNNTYRSLQNQFQSHPSYEDNDEEPSILRSEVQQAIKTSPKNKSPGIDGITNEAILASGEIGISWLTPSYKKHGWKEKSQTTGSEQS